MARQTAPSTATDWLTDEQQQAWRAVVRMQTMLTDRLDRDLVEHSGISGADYSVLVALSEAPTGRMRSFELGRATQWEKSRLSHHLNRMEKRGLIAREACSTDARGADIVLTTLGRRTIRFAAPRHVASVRRYVIDVLTPDQLAALAASSSAVIDALEAAD